MVYRWHRSAVIQGGCAQTRSARLQETAVTVLWEETEIGQVMKTDPGSVQVTGGLAPFRAHAGDSLSSDSSELWINFYSLSVCLYVFRGMMKQFWVQVWSDVITKICYWPFIISPPHLVPYKSAIILYRCLKCISYHLEDTIFGTVPTFLYLAAKDFLIFTGTLCPWLVHESWW